MEQQLADLSDRPRAPHHLAALAAVAADTDGSTHTIVPTSAREPESGQLQLMLDVVDASTPVVAMPKNVGPSRSEKPLLVHRGSGLAIAPMLKLRMKSSVRNIRRRGREQPTMRSIMRKTSVDDDHSRRSSTDSCLMTRRSLLPPPSQNGRRQARCQPSVAKTGSRKFWPDLVLTSAHLKATSKFRWCWDIYTMLLLCYTAVAVPFEIAFVQQDEVDALFIFDRCVDLSFFIDMIFSFITPYWDPHANAMVEELPLIAKQYLKGWFWLDLVSVLPFDIIGLFMDESFRQLMIFRILRILRIIKLVRVFRASRIFSRWQAQLNIPMAVFKLIGHLATILLLAHWLGCLWGGIVHFENHKDAQGNKLSWMSQYGIADKGMQTQYVTSLYWAVVTILTIGYGDIPVVTLEERGVAIVCMIAGCGTYSFVIGSICGVLSSMDEATTDFRQNMDHLNMLLQKERLPKHMVITFREYFLHTQDLMNHKYFSKVLDTLSPGLKGELGVYTSGEWIHRVPFFQGGPRTEHTKFVTAITQHLSAMLFPPNESLIRRGDLTDRMFILSKGLVARLGKVIGKGNFVGEDVILANGVRHYEVRSLTFVDAMVLTRASLQEVLRGHFPHKMKKIRRASIWLSLARKMEYFLEELKYLRASPTHSWSHAEEADWFRARMFNDHDLDLESSPLHVATKCVAAAQKALAAAIALDTTLPRRDDFFALTTCVNASYAMLEDSCRRNLNATGIS